ncbi:MAG: ATP-binding protein [Candidatus Longimicrobiales bacterium M2_2A_002]
MGDPLNRDRARNQLDLLARWTDELAHEIKNPFHAMVINLELVKRRAGDAEGLRERTVVVESELHRVHALVDSVLRLVRPWPKTGTVDVDAAFEALLPAVRARAALHQLDYEHEPGGATAAIAPADFALILLNLLDNAMDALPEAGRLRTRFARDDDTVTVRVTDDGPGLGALDGDPFAAGTTGREDRKGLGLAVSRRLARDAGGDLVASAPRDGDGAALILTLPRPG